MANRIGFVGLGNMGEPMVRNLAFDSQKVVAMDMSAERRALLDGVDGVQTTESIADMSDCDVVILMLPNGHIVKDILTGAGNLAAALPSGSLIIDMSSSDPIIYGDVADPLAARDIDIVDAPVSGNVTGA
ncbi:MAG: NAD(P)-binding domain-containing protein, partial [Donghicola eburneus]